MDKLLGQRCIAYTRLRKPCPSDRERNSKWCSLHEELQGKCMRIYKHHSRELDKFTIENPYPLHNEDSVSLYRSPKTISQEEHHPILISMIPRREDVKNIDDVDILSVWHQIARRTWTLANRAVFAREHHHSQFYQDGDEGHRRFTHILRHKQDVLESLMSAIDEKLFKTTLENEKAGWLLPQPLELECADSTSGDSSSEGAVFTEIECEHERTAIESNSTPPSSPVPNFEQVDEYEIKSNQRSQMIMCQLTDYLDFPIHSSNMDEGAVSEIKEIIRNVFRRVMVRDAGLFVRAKEMDQSTSLNNTIAGKEKVWRRAEYACPVKAFITSGKLSLKELQRLWRLLKFGKEKIGPELIRNAIADVFRSQDDHEDAHSSIGSKKSSKIWVLGGYVWRKAMNGPLPRSGADYFYAFVKCSGCMLSTCRTFQEWADNRRLALIGPRYPEWLDPVDLPIEKLLRSLRICVSRHNSKIKRSKLEKVIPKCKALKTVYTEVQERHFIHLCLPLNDSRSRKIIDALAANKACYDVFAQRRVTGEISHRPGRDTDLWCTRTRSAYSTAERRKKTFTPSTMFRADENLFKCALKSPEQSFNRTFEDCWDLLVMDSKVLDFVPFIMSIGKVLMDLGECIWEDGTVDMEFNGFETFSDKDFESKLLASDLRYLRAMFREVVTDDSYN